VPNEQFEAMYRYVHQLPSLTMGLRAVLGVEIKRMHTIRRYELTMRTMMNTGLYT
jgi:hypothetical protein